MEKYYMRQNYSTDMGVNIVFDQTFQAAYLVSGRTGKAGDELLVQDMRGEVLVRLRQISYGIIPRFVIAYRNQVIASISFNLAYFGDIIYVRRLAWVISGNFLNHRYNTYHSTKKLLTVKPEARPDGLYNQLTVTDSSDQVPVHIIIAALLDIWNTGFDTLSPRNWLTQYHFRLYPPTYRRD
ncbi:hypothetical protein OZX65_04845 [Leuconostocaceae bacterium ESL0723]|nr:hypothetical protein OZX65_04845 [Leuconostocaceae bacterium ESL0723]